MDLKAYDAVSGVACSLMKNNPRLSQDNADWLAQHWAEENAVSNWTILGQPAHKVISAHLYQAEELLAVEASDNSLDLWWKGKFTLEQSHERIKNVPNVQIGFIPDAGYTMHRPEILAGLFERGVSEFLCVRRFQKSADG